MTKIQRSYEYVNDFLYFVVRPVTEGEKQAWVYCSGVNISRFSPITKGRHGIGNPSVRALQNVNHGVRSLALSKGARPRALRGNDCAGITPPKDTWYTELLLIENASESFPHEMIDYCVRDLLTRIFRACLLELKLPDKLLKPDELQVFLEDLCVKYG
ncbi:MAG TPA: hypothetical protein VFG09_05885 [Thermodesulfovibrionales bacterium]|nr:hypothetical protein [Thermodesulfovibrionales bacterium]